MCGPNDITTAKSVKSARIPAGDDFHARTVARARADTAINATERPPTNQSTRPRFVIFRNGSRTVQPKRIATSTTDAAATPHPKAVSTRPATWRALAWRHAAMIAIAASAKIVKPGKSAFSAFGHASITPPHRRRFGSAVRYAYTSAEK